MAKIVISEYGDPLKILSLTEKLEIAGSELVELFQKANSKICRQLGLKADVLICNGENVYAKDIAGIFHLSRNIELEVIPKFLGVSQTAWKDDFLEILLLTNSGKILFSDHISGSVKDNSSLYDILAREFIRKFNENKKYCIRQYRKEEFYDYSIDGEIDFASILDRNPDGIKQYTSRFDRDNVYNSIISMAAQIIRGKVRDYQNVNGLNGIISFLGQQKVRQITHKPALKSRDKRWKELYDVSYEIVKNMSFIYQDAKHVFSTPGYIFSTWQIWQNIIEHALLTGIKDKKVVAQHEWFLGSKVNQLGDKDSIVVKPDIAIIERESNQVLLLLDAKYKGRFYNGTFSISNADIYEGMAFCQATGCKRIILLYPRTENDPSTDIGKLTIFNSISVGDVQIIGAKVEMAGIANIGGLKAFVNTLGLEIRPYMEQEVR